MESNVSKPIPIIDAAAVEPKEHPRFRGIYLKGLLTSAENPFANVNIVHVPPGGVIGHHHHPEQIETIYVLKGQSVFFVGGTEVHFNAGQIVAVPIGMEHGLRNLGSEQVELLTFFTPPITLLKRDG
jgi:quercetin dioxygenase-like cupin family protein